MSDLDARFQAGCAAVLAGGRLARRHFGHLDALQVDQKGPQDHASAADREVERLIVDLLGRAFPSDGFFGEEGGGQARDDLWVIDPIDGTTNFIHGLSEYCVSLAYVRGGAVQLGMPYFLFSKGLHAVSLQEASLIALIEPVLNPLWVALVVGEIPSKATVAGGGMILLGLGVRYVWPLLKSSAEPVRSAP